MRNFWILLALSFALLFAGCRVLDIAASALVKPKPKAHVTDGMSHDQYVAWYNSHRKVNPGLTDPSKEAKPVAVPDAPIEKPVAPIAQPLPDLVSSADFEPTAGGKVLELAGDAAPVPFGETATKSILAIAALYSAYRHNSKKNKQIKSLVVAIDKDGSDDVKEMVEKIATREGVNGDLHKVVKVVKAASALAKPAKLEI